MIVAFSHRCTHVLSPPSSEDPVVLAAKQGPEVLTSFSSVLSQVMADPNLKLAVGTGMTSADQLDWLVSESGDRVGFANIFSPAQNELHLRCPHLLYDFSI